MQSISDFPDGSSEPVYGDDHEVVTFTQPAHAFGPTWSVATSASRCGVGEHPIRRDARSPYRVVLLVDRLLPGGYPEIRGGAHGHMHPPASDLSSGVRSQGTRIRL